MVLAERAFFLSCSRLRLWIFSMTSSESFRLLNFSFGNLASRLMRFLRLILARDSGVPFFRRELRRPSDGMLASSEDIAALHYNALRSVPIITPYRHPRPWRPTRGRCSRALDTSENLDCRRLCSRKKTNRLGPPTGYFRNYEIPEAAHGCRSSKKTLRIPLESMLRKVDFTGIHRFPSAQSHTHTERTQVGAPRLGLSK